MSSIFNYFFNNAAKSYIQKKETFAFDSRIRFNKVIIKLHI